ncbi:MAG: TlyA family rRNA (cytidine-2'-O)-methyltransferase [Thermodesulfovibrionia bacterium]
MIPSEKTRLDRLLFERGLVDSREKARALILEGKVLVNGVAVDKPGSSVSHDASITIKEGMPYVSRGGLKLEKAINAFGMDLKDKTAMDIGASTGGFTDCLLKHGVRKVYAIDVGYGQFDWRLRRDQRVTLLERTNIRYLDRSAIPETVDIITIDVSFISLLKVIPRSLDFLSPNGEIIALIKPQFELQKRDVGKGGVVRDGQKRLKAVERIVEGVNAMGLDIKGIFESPVHGPRGNIEYFIYLKRKKG